MMKHFICLVFAALFLAIQPMATPASSTQCVLTAADKMANAKLSFDDFDQKGVTPVTFRQLANRGCYTQAAEAAEDYLIHGALLNPSEQRNVLFHLGQAEALLGNERGAAKLIAGTKNLTQSSSAEFDWNTYVEGAWAFLVKDRKVLEAAYAKLSHEPGDGNAINSRALAGLIRCFDQPFAKAYSNECRSK